MKKLFHTRLSWPWIALLLATLSCNFPGNPPLKPIPSQTPGDFNNQPVLASEQSASPAERIEIQAGRLEPLASGSTGPQGGTIQVAAPGSSLDGFSIQVPEGAYTQEVKLEISAAPILSHNLDPGLQIVTPLINVESGDDWAGDFLKLHLPIQLAPEQFAMLFTYDPEYGRLDALPLAEQDEMHLVALTTHFSKIFGISVNKAELDALNIKTSFVQGVDNWQFKNLGSFIAPNGHCSGQSITAMDYFLSRRNGQLYGKYDPYNNAHAPTLGLQFDDRAGYRLASVVQNNIDWDNWQRKFWLNVQDTSDELTYYAFALALRASREPQYVTVRNSAGGHALILYEKFGDRLYVSDPNYPQPTARRAIVYARPHKTFLAYYSGPDASQTGKAYFDIAYMNKYSMTNPARLASYWAQLENGTIGTDLFPEYQISVFETDDLGDFNDLSDIPDLRSESSFQVFSSRIVVAERMLEFSIDAPEFQAAVDVYDESLRKVGDFNELLPYQMDSPAVQGSYLFVVWGWKNGKWNWVDGRWTTIVRSYEGAWDSGPRCNEAFETPYRWSVSLLQDETGSITGTIHFHNCPNGGQVFYRVTGQPPDAGGVLVLEGQKTDGIGALNDSAPAMQRFTVQWRQPPEPNLAP